MTSEEWESLGGDADLGPAPAQPGGGWGQAGRGSAPAAFPGLRNSPCGAGGATQGQGGHSPSTLEQLHGELRVLPVRQCHPRRAWGHHPGRMEQGKAAQQSEKGQEHPKAQLTPTSHHGGGVALNLCTHKASEP